MRFPKLPALTQAQWDEANDALPPTYDPCGTLGEAYCVLDAIANGDDPGECLAEYRYWRSPTGRDEELRG